MRHKIIWSLLMLLVVTGTMLPAGCGPGENATDPPAGFPAENGAEIRNGEAPEGPVNGEPAVEKNNSGNAVAAACCWDYQPSSMQPRPGWDTVNLEGLSREALLDVLGCPPHIIRMTSVVDAAYNRELWVYHPYDEDPTGLFIWLKGNFYHSATLNEFSGFWCYEMSDLDFWE